MKEKERRGLTGKLQAGEVADGSRNRVVSGSSSRSSSRPGTESAAAARGGRRRTGKRPPFTPPCLPAASSAVAGTRGRRGGGHPAADADAVSAVAHGWCIEAGRRRSAGNPGRASVSWPQSPYATSPCWSFHLLKKSKLPSLKSCRLLHNYQLLWYINTQVSCNLAMQFLMYCFGTLCCSTLVQLQYPIFKLQYAVSLVLYKL
jgi:hypothetical protein